MFAQLKSKFKDEKRQHHNPLWCLLICLGFTCIVSLLVGCGEYEETELAIEIMPPSAPAARAEFQAALPDIAQIKITIPDAEIEQTIPFTGSGTKVTINDIPVGKYTVSVQLLNSENRLLYKGDSPVNITAGNVTQSAITVAIVGEQFEIDIDLQSDGIGPKSGDSTTTFTAKLTPTKYSHGDPNLQTYQWDWGDGTTVSLKGPMTETHKYGKTGEFEIKPMFEGKLKTTFGGKDKAKEKVAIADIVPGGRFGKIQIDVPFSKVIEVNGQPDLVEDNVFGYNTGLGPVVGIVADPNRNERIEGREIVELLIVVSSYRGKTLKGSGINSSMDEVQQEFGQPDIQRVDDQDNQIIHAYFERGITFFYGVLSRRVERIILSIPLKQAPPLNPGVFQFQLKQAPPINPRVFQFQ